LADHADTLDAYIDKYSSLVPYLADNATGTPASDAAPAEQTLKAISLQVSQLPIPGFTFHVITRLLLANHVNPVIFSLFRNP